MSVESPEDWAEEFAKRFEQIFGGGYPDAPQVNAEYWEAFLSVLEPVKDAPEDQDTV